MIIGLTGVSGVGKTTIIKALSKYYPNLYRVSSTILLMKAYGIASDEFNNDPTPEMYKSLETISSQDKIDMLSSDLFKQQLLATQKNSSGIYLYEIHLVIPARKEQDVEYITQPLPRWSGEVFAGIVYIDVSPGEINKRKQRDAISAQRDRGESTITMESTTIQKELSDTKWREQIDHYPNLPHVTISNEGDLDYTVDQIKDFISTLR